MAGIQGSSKNKKRLVAPRADPVCSSILKVPEKLQYLIQPEEKKKKKRPYESSTLCRAANLISQSAHHKVGWVIEQALKAKRTEFEPMLYHWP